MTLCKYSWAVEPGNKASRYKPHIPIVFLLWGGGGGGGVSMRLPYGTFLHRVMSHGGKALSVLLLGLCEHSMVSMYPYLHI